jgi:outer membrane lipoprotein-sorting protein
MNTKRNLWIGLGMMILAAALISGFVLTQASAEDILVEMFETAKTINDGHAVVAFEIDSVERDASGSFEIWAQRGDEHHGAFRVEVLDASEEKAQGAIFVSDGETLWAYSPAENKVFVGTPEEAKAMMAENQDMFAQYGQEYGEMGSKHEGQEVDRPENSEEAVAKLLEYFTVSKSKGSEVSGEQTTLIKLEPIAEQMPAEFVAVGGYLNLAVGRESSLPLEAAYTASTLGEFNATVLEFEFNAGVDSSLFSFEVPAGAEVVTFADFEAQALSLDEARDTVGFEILTPGELPEGATLVDILEIRSALVQRYNLAEGGSFTIAQGSYEAQGEAGETPAEAETVEVRGTSGQALIDETGAKVLLTWVEDEMFFSVAGDLTLEQALSIAESLE